MSNPTGVLASSRRDRPQIGDQVEAYGPAPQIGGPGAARAGPYAGEIAGFFHRDVPGYVKLFLYGRPDRMAACFDSRGAAAPAPAPGAVATWVWRWPDQG